MDEHELARRELRAKKNRESVAALASIGITPAEASLFNVIHFSLTLPPLELSDRATWITYWIGEPVTEEQTQAALSRCLADGRLQIIDEAALARIRDEVRSAGLLGPIYKYPPIGGVDFTHAGAAEWFRICDLLWGGGSSMSFGFCDVVHEKSAYYFSSEAKAAAGRAYWLDCDTVHSVTGPVSIGPWRANWWRRFPKGYRIDVEERMQWQGRAGCGGFVSFYTRDMSIDLARATEVLQRHQVQWAEWLALASLEHSSQRNRILGDAEEQSQRFGMRLSSAECERGLEGCLSRGWLRPMDAQVWAEIGRLLQADNAIMPVPHDLKQHWGELDFTVEGAQLYRQISAEILGPDWEETLEVEVSYFREEHRYCATQAGIDAVHQEYAQSGETPRSVQIVRIGPWCVYWWERFESGYRMELTFGEP